MGLACRLAAVAAQALTVGKTTEYVVMNWRPEAGTQLTIVPLNGDQSRIRTFQMPAWFTFHYVNAFGTFLFPSCMPSAVFTLTTESTSMYSFLAESWLFLYGLSMI